MLYHPNAVHESAKETIRNYYDNKQNHSKIAPTQQESEQKNLEPARHTRTLKEREIKNTRTLSFEVLFPKSYSRR